MKLPRRDECKLSLRWESRAHCPPQKLQAVLPQGRIRLSRKGKAEAWKDLDGIHESLTRASHGNKVRVAAMPPESCEGNGTLRWKGDACSICKARKEVERSSSRRAMNKV